MSRITNEAERSYRSPLRDEHVEDTRARILDAAARVMATGLATVSVPAVAREAGVSVPTVYRHFGTKQDLLAAVYPHLLHRAGLDRISEPQTIDELLDGMRDYVERVESFDDLARAAMASPAAEDVRRLSMPRRYAGMQAVAASVRPGLDDDVRDRLARLLLVLTSSSALRLWRDQLGRSVDDVAEEVEWMVRAVVELAKGEQEERA